MSIRTQKFEEILLDPVKYNISNVNNFSDNNKDNIPCQHEANNDIYAKEDDFQQQSADFAPSASPAKNGENGANMDDDCVSIDVTAENETLSDTKFCEEVIYDFICQNRINPKSLGLISFKQEVFQRLIQLC